MKTWLRWLLVPISPLVLLLTLFVIGRAVMRFANRQCPDDAITAGLCVEPWMTTVMDSIIYFSIVVAAFGLVFVPTLIAPKLKRVIAIVGFLPVPALFGTVWYFTLWPDLVFPLFTALISGGIALGFVWTRDRSTT